MKRMLLTSTGFGNPHFTSLFLDKIGKEVGEIKAIFVPTAATGDDAKEMLPYCYQDLTKVGILPENIFTYELRYLMTEGHEKTPKAGQNNIPKEFRLLSPDEFKNYDAIYFCGGDPAYLLGEVNRTGLKILLKQAVENGLFYIGTSAGAMIAAGNFPDGLRFIKNSLYVHCKNGTRCGKLPKDEEIFLSNRQAVWIEGEKHEIIT